MCIYKPMQTDTLYQKAKSDQKEGAYTSDGLTTKVKKSADVAWSNKSFSNLIIS